MTPALTPFARILFLGVARTLEEEPLACYGCDTGELRRAVEGDTPEAATFPGGPVGWLRAALLDVDHAEHHIGNGPRYGDNGEIIEDDRPCFERTRAILRAAIDTLSTASGSGLVKS